MMKKKHFYVGVAAGLIACLAVFGFLGTRYVQRNYIPVTETTSVYQNASDSFRESVMSGLSTSKYAVLSGGRCGLFISYSNGRYAPTVCHAVKRDIQSAWVDVDRQIKQYVADSVYTGKYLKLDIVSTVRDLDFASLRNELAECDTGAYHWGMAFDKNFDVALLEQELAGYRVYDWDGHNVSISKLNSYLPSRAGMMLDEMPEQLWMFQCDSWLYDIETGVVTKLSSDDANYGLRELPLTRENLVELISTAGLYLSENIGFDGRFNYSFWPLISESDGDYNLIRHLCALWGLEQYYELTGDVSVQGSIQLGINFLQDYFVKSGEMAGYVRCTDFDESPNEIRMGSSGLVLTVLSEYERLFSDSTYRDMLIRVANGILEQMQPDGHVPHVLDLELNVTGSSRVAYYDGEMLLGLCKAYRVTENPDYLDGAVKLGDYCLDRYSEGNGDHWFCAAMYELVGLFPNDIRYYNAALLTVTGRSDDFHDLRRDPTLLEQLMAVFDVYQLAIERNVAIPGDFDSDELLNLIDIQSRDALQNYVFPERGMFAQMPEAVIGTFYTEESNGWNVRVDTVQHHMTAFYRMYCDYDKLFGTR